MPPSDSDLYRGLLPQGVRLIIPEKPENQEWHDWLNENTAEGFDGLDFMDMQNGGENGDYPSRIWLQCEYEEYCRGTNSIRMVAANDRERDANIANWTLNRLVDNFVTIITQTWENPCFAEDPYDTHNEVTRLKQISSLLRPAAVDGLEKLLRPYARETIRTILQSAKFRNKSQVAKFKGNEFIRKLGIRFSTITDYTLLKLREMYPSKASLCPNCANPILDFGEIDSWCIDCYRIGSDNVKEIQNSQFVDEKLAYNFTLLLLEEQWLEVYPGSFDDLVTISGSTEDEVKTTKPYPSMFYLSSRFYDLVHDREKYVKNTHAVFRWFSMDTDRWCYAEPEGHHWIEENVAEPEEIEGQVTDEQLFSYDFAFTRYKNQGHGVPRGYLTADDNQLPFQLSRMRRQEIGERGHRPLRILISKQDEFELLGDVGRTKATLSKKNIIALNHLQKTQWEINLDFLSAISVADVKDTRMGEEEIFSLREGIILPENKETLERWQDTILSNYIPKILRFSKNVFWHVWACDFRGRMSPRCMVLSPQASDMDRALLRFKEWKTLGERGWYWLRVHLFNLIAGKEIFGNIPSSKKLSFDLRAKWVQDHIDDYLKIASNPLEQSCLTAWQEKPRSKGESLQRLAAILEVARVWNLHKDGKSWDEIESGHPIQLDASNNGYQHISALLRNKELAEAVNVVCDSDSTNTDTPVQDLYVRVSDKARKNWDTRTSKLSQNFSEDKRFSEDRVGKVFDRKFAKQITMTMAYGAVDVSGIYSGNKNKKPKFTRQRFVFAGETEGSFEYGGKEFANFEKFSEYVHKNEPSIKKDEVVKPIWEIPSEAPDWARIKSGYDDPDKRVTIHLRNLNSDRKRKGKPPVWAPSWHPDSLLRQVFRENEFTSEEQQKIADDLSKDYQKAVEEVTNNAMYNTKSHLRATVRNSKNNILFWEAPTGFRIRNFYPVFHYKVKWSTYRGGTWTRYWGSKNSVKQLISSYVGIFNIIEELLGPELADIDQLLRDAFKDKDGKYTELENAFLSLGISNSDLQEYIDNPWTRSKNEGKSFMKRLDTEWLGQEEDGRKIKLCLINYLAKNRLNPLFQKKNLDLDDLNMYNSLARRLLVSISYNPGRFSPNVTEIVDGETTTAKTLQRMQIKITPNYIHSMDAAHMAMVVNKMFSEHGIRDFWAVHDCFGVHPSDTDALVQVVRETFHEIYSNRTLADVEGGEFEVPTDAFDIDEILNSEYIIG